MEDLLDNPVYNALLSGDSHFNIGNNKTVFFDEEVSPFAGFDNENKNGFEELRDLLPQGRKILYANSNRITIPTGWKLLAEIAGLQFVLYNYVPQEQYLMEPVSLEKENVEEMINLTALTKPGPFNQRTIEFGQYFGIFQDNRLAAMTGERMHISNYTEVSAVCTHPDYLGKGFAGTLLHHQINLILKTGQTPFLHVRADNVRAIELYKRIGFKESRTMNFYFLKKE